MVVVMFVGMAVLSPLWDLGASLAGQPDLLDDTTWMTVSMVTDMVVAMALWMWVRGHRLLPTVEMCGAMIAPFVLLAGPVAWGWLSAGGLLVWGHVLMLPAMLGVMWLRRDEYSHHHGWRWSKHRSSQHAT
jgi:hypothetical protein